MKPHLSWVAGVALLGACLRNGFDTHASLDATSGNDGADDVVQSDVVQSDSFDTTPPGDITSDTLAGFGSPTLVSSLNTPNPEDDPWLTDDMLEIFFGSTRPGGKGEEDIWTSTRSNATDEWLPPTPVAELNSTTYESRPSLSSDGLTIVFASMRAGGPGEFDLYTSSRSSRNSGWSPPVLITELCSPERDSSPRLSPDQKILFFSSKRPGLGDYDLYSATRSTSTMQWSPPSAMPAINTAYRDDTPWFNDALTVIFFTTDRPGGTGSMDIWTARRDSPLEPFGDQAPVPHINSTSEDSAPWLSPDMKVIYFASGRFGNDEIFTAVAP